MAGTNSMPVDIHHDTYKGKPSLVMESNRLKTTFVLTGSRMVSLFDKRTCREFLLQGRSEKYIAGAYDGYFPDCDPCGFDEMFPSINDCVYAAPPWEGIRIPDHGEVWSLDWDHRVSADSSLEMCVHGVRFPYRLEKKIRFTQDNLLRIDYRAVNLSQFDMTFLWAAHPMLKVEEESELILPPESRTGFCVFDDGGRLGGYGTLFDIAETVGGSRKRAGEVIHAMRDGTYKCTEKYYIHDRLTTGRCGARFPSDGTVIMLRFPTDTVPYLGVLAADGGIDPAGCVAILEPCTAPYDRPDFAKAYGGGSVLKAKGTHEWYLEIEIQ